MHAANRSNDLGYLRSVRFPWFRFQLQKLTNRCCSHDVKSLFIVSVVYGIFSGACERSYPPVMCDSNLYLDRNRALGCHHVHLIAFAQPRRSRVCAQQRWNNILSVKPATYDPHSARTGLALAFGSLGSLCSGPAQGSLLTGTFLWLRPVAFSGVRYWSFFSHNIHWSSCLTDRAF